MSVNTPTFAFSRTRLITVPHGSNAAAGVKAVSLDHKFALALAYLGFYTPTAEGTAAALIVMVLPFTEKVSPSLNDVFAWVVRPPVPAAPPAGP